MPARKPLPPFAPALLVAWVVSGGGAAQGAGTDDPADELTYDLRVDLPITLAAGAVWLGTDLVGDRFAPAACRWCASNDLDDGVRSALRWQDGGAAHTASNALAYVALPALELGMMALAVSHDNRAAREMGGSSLVIGQAVAISGVLVQLVKYSAGRERPFVHALSPALKSQAGDPGDQNLSFYSSHTSFAFALATSAGTVATLRGYRWAPAIWAVGALAAATTGYLRIAADRHYFTDVLAGAVAGTAIGVGVPTLFHRRRYPHRLTLVPIATPQLSVLALAGVF